MPNQPDAGAEPTARIHARTPARVSELANLRAVCRSMVDSGVGAVLVENPVGPEGLILARDIIEALAGGAEPDTVWAGEIMRPGPRMVSHKQHPIDVGAEMVAYELEVVAVFDEDASVRVASALDVLCAVIRLATDEPSDS